MIERVQSKRIFGGIVAALGVALAGLVISFGAAFATTKGFEAKCEQVRAVQHPTPETLEWYEMTCS